VLRFFFAPGLFFFSRCSWTPCSCPQRLDAACPSVEAARHRAFSLFDRLPLIWKLGHGLFPFVFTRHGAVPSRDGGALRSAGSYTSQNSLVSIFPMMRYFFTRWRVLSAPLISSIPPVLFSDSRVEPDGSPVIQLSCVPCCYSKRPSVKPPPRAGPLFDPGRIPLQL